MQCQQKSESERLLQSMAQDLICPISHQIMLDPVVIETGHTFQREAIELWFKRGNRSNPLSGLRVASTRVRPNICARNIIEKLPIDLKRTNSQVRLQQSITALQEIWRKAQNKNIFELHEECSQLSKQNNGLKEDLKLICEQKLIEKLQMEAEIQMKEETIQELRKQNATLRMLLEKQAQLRWAKDDKITNLERQLEKIRLGKLLRGNSVIMSKEEERLKNESQLFVPLDKIQVQGLVLPRIKSKSAQKQRPNSKRQEDNQEENPRKNEMKELKRKFSIREVLRTSRRRGHQNPNSNSKPPRQNLN